MSELSRLRELAALFRPVPLHVQEARKQKDDIVGLRRVVDESIEDLEMKLGQDGAMSDLLDAAEIDKMAAPQMKESIALVAKFKKDVGSLLDEVEMMLQSTNESINEMANIRNFSSGWLKSAQAKTLVAQFRNGKETADLKDGSKYKAVKTLAASDLAKGMVVMGSYNAYNQGAEIYEIKGVTGDDRDNDDVKFDSVKDAMRAAGVKSIKALGNASEGYRIVVKDLEDGDEGAFFYISGTRYVRGSGAETVSFTLVEKV